MTVRQAIDRLQALKPHQYTDETAAGWLSDLDGRLYANYCQGHEGMENRAHGPYTAEADSAELMVEEPYTDLYIRYMAAQVDYHNAEFARYNNSMVMYNMLLAEYANWINRTHMPAQRAALKP